MVDTASRRVPRTVSKKLKVASTSIPSGIAHTFASAPDAKARVTHTTVAGYPLHGVPRLIALERVCDMLCLKGSAVHAKVATGELPAPVKFGTSRRAAARWLEHEIVAFILAKAAARAEISTVDATKRGSQ